MTWETSNRRSRLPANWSSLRQAQLHRDRGICQNCGTQAATRYGRAWRGGQVDHIEPMADDHTRLQTLCDDCHKAKSAREGHDAQAARRAAARRPVTPHPGMVTQGGGVPRNDPPA